MRRAAIATPSNIAEGSRQGALRAYLRHVRIAAGSTAESETQAQIATDMKLWLPDHAMEVHRLVESTGQMLTALIKPSKPKPSEKARQGILADVGCKERLSKAEGRLTEADDDGPL